MDKPKYIILEDDVALKGSIIAIALHEADRDWDHAVEKVVRLKNSRLKRDQKTLSAAREVERDKLLTLRAVQAAAQKFKEEHLISVIEAWKAHFNRNDWPYYKMQGQDPRQAVKRSDTCGNCGTYPLTETGTCPTSCMPKPALSIHYRAEYKMAQSWKVDVQEGTLTDDCKVYNVVLVVEDRTATFECVTQKEAEDLALVIKNLPVDVHIG